MGCRQSERPDNQGGADAEWVLLVGEVVAKLHERRGRLGGGKRTVSSLPGDRRYDFDTCNISDINEVPSRRGRDAEHPDRAYLAHVPLHHGATVKEVGCHLATLLQDDL